jgi:hypothetical protein
MSQSHVSRQPRAPRPIVWWQIALALATLMIGVAAAYLIVNWVHSFPSAYETANGKVLEIRKVVDHTSDTIYGGKISYRAEALVRYTADGKTQDRWLHASDNLPQDSLLLKLAANPAECFVYWSPGHPENAKCSLK